MSIAILTIFALSILIQSFLEVVNIIEKTLNFVHSFLSTLKDVLNTINTHLKLCVENKKQSEKFFLLIGSTNSKPSKMTYFEKCVLKTIFIQTTIQDSLESQITIQDSLESKNSEYSKFTVKKARELISQTISKNKSLVAPKKSAKKQILINWLTDNL